jgi:hypothetical protein
MCIGKFKAICRPAVAKSDTLQDTQAFNYCKLRETSIAYSLQREKYSSITLVVLSEESEVMTTF